MNYKTIVATRIANEDDEHTTSEEVDFNRDVLQTNTVSETQDRKSENETIGQIISRKRGCRNNRI